LDITTTLDPHYEEVYELGAVILATELGNVDKSIALLSKGMKNVSQRHERYWYLPFYIAFNYMYYKGDNQKAAHYLEIASKSPESPAYLPLLISRLYANTDNSDMAIAFLQNMIEQTDSAELRHSLIKRIKDIQVLQHSRLLQNACEVFHTNTGQYPLKLEDLLSTQLVAELPEEPYGGVYMIGKDCSIQSSSDVDDLKLHIKK
jgi:hypothetical protein